MSTDELAAEIVGRCRERMDAGEDVDVEAVVRAHPEIAATLRERFDALARLDRGFGRARTATDTAAAALVGRTLGPWRLASVLGSGGMGTVFLAEGDGARAAVKVIHPHLLTRRGFLERFLREAEIGKLVRHQNVVATLDAEAADVDGRAVRFLVMEHVEGRTLRALLEELGRVPEELCRHVGREVTRALTAIHAAGAVHRDLKPDNVLITQDDVVKVMDLGVARLAEDAARLSQTGAFVGSVRYAAPEQFGRPVPRSATREARSAEVDGRADLYALGLTLYELATGRHPFEGDDVRVVIRQQMTEAPRPAGEVNPQLSPFFEEVLRRLLEKDRDARFASATALLDVLEQGESSAWWQDRARTIRADTRRPLRRIRIPRETALYGRDAELTRLRSLYERAKAGEGQVALIEGEAGIGKSRLVDEFVLSLWAAGEDIDFLYGSYPPGGAATASGAFVTAYREHLGDDEASIRAALPATPLLVPAFAALLRGDVAPEGAEKLTKDSLQAVFVHATRSFAARRTTIVLIDDLHFAPAEGRALFASLALGVPGHRILLLGGARPSLDEKWLAGLAMLPHLTRVPLARLGAKDLVLLLRDSLRSEHLAEELAARIAVKSDGNPFFVFEILRGLREGQFITKRSDGTWATTREIREIQVPSSIVELVQARVSDLGELDRNVLEVAACVGFEFDPALVGEVLALGRIPLLQRLGRIEKSHRLVRSAGRHFVFDHHQVMEVLYAGLSEPLREEYHAALGTAIETTSGAASKEPEVLDGALCADLAEHFLRGAQGARALRYLGAALTHLVTRNFHEAVVRLADRVLAVPALVAGRSRCELLLRKIFHLGVLGRGDAQSTALEELTALAEEDGTAAVRTRALHSLGNSHLRSARFDEARAAFGLAIPIAQAAGDRREEASLTGDLGIALQHLDRLEEAREHSERGLALAREVGDQRCQFGCILNLATISQKLGRMEEAQEGHERALALTREMRYLRGEAAATGNLGNVFLLLGRFVEAQECHERQLALAREIGDRQNEAAATGSLGHAFFLRGRLAEARERHERHMALAREIGDREGEARAAANLASVYRCLGRFGPAREHAERHLSLYRRVGSRRNEVCALQSLADLCAEEGDVVAAERRYSEALALSRAIYDCVGEAETLRALGGLVADAGRTDEARVRLGAALSMAHELRLPYLELLAAASLATLPGREVAAALSALATHERHVEMREAMEARCLLWQATRDPAHLAEAKRVLDFLVEHAPADCRESMLANVRLHREIAAAAREQALLPAADSSRTGDERSAASADA